VKRGEDPQKELLAGRKTGAGWGLNGLAAGQHRVIGGIRCRVSSFRKAISQPTKEEGGKNANLEMQELGSKLSMAFTLPEIGRYEHKGEALKRELCDE